MSEFVDAILNFTRRTDADIKATFVETVAEAKSSIQVGSALTGAPGQVVADYMGGELRASWQLEWPTAEQAIISTASNHAPQNEDGIARPGGGPYIQRSSVGGRWSIALTKQNFDRIVDSVAARFRRRS